MKDTLKTTLLEYEKSSFLIELVKHQNEQLYISLKQRIYKEGIESSIQEVKINPSLLPDIIAVINDYLKEIPASQIKFNEELKKEIQKRYFSGVAIKDLALQFGCSVSLIEQLLINNGIEIVSNEIPWYLKGKRRKQKRKN